MRVDEEMSHLPTIGFFLSALVASCLGDVLTADNLPNHQKLADDYDLYWDFNLTHIMFQAHVKTNGYIGLGISDHGGMYPSDVIITWIKDGEVHFSDRHAIGLFMPVLDTSQDWYLVEGKEEGDYTTVTMVRALDTCDTDDRAIGSDTTRIIYSYSPVDPDTDDSIGYHGIKRGTKSLLLLTPDKNSQLNPLPNDVNIVDLGKRNYALPSSETTYSCSLLKLPPLEGKHHLIRYEPYVTPGHETMVHHMILFSCSQDMDESELGTDRLCSEDRKRSVHCNDHFVTWVIGGTVFDYPSHVGQPLGGPGDPRYFVLEIHYNNPYRRSGLVDNSGFRLYLTKTLRPFDAAMALLAVSFGPYQMVPPYYDNFLSKGSCDAACLAMALGDDDTDDQIYMFASLQHAHMATKRMVTRHIRNGTELPPLVDDRHYDFNFQEMRRLPEERTVKKGDSFIIECYYDTSSRIGLTVGGMSAINEMCVNFILYYPKKSIRSCNSRVDYASGEQKYGKNIFELVLGMDFRSKDVRERFQDYVNEAPVINTCEIDKTLSYPGEIPTVTTPYQPVDRCNP